MSKSTISGFYEGLSFVQIEEEFPTLPCDMCSMVNCYHLLLFGMERKHDLSMLCDKFCPRCCACSCMHLVVCIHSIPRS